MAEFYKDSDFYLFFAILIGIFLRIYNLTAQSFWLDELASVEAATNGIQHMIYRMVNDVHPPLYQIVLYIWIKIFHTSSLEFTARSLSVVAGITSIFVMLIYTRKYFGKYISNSATILLSLTYAGIYYSQEARSYSILMLMSIVSLYYLTALVTSEKNSTKTYQVYAVISIITAYIHYFGLIFIGLQFIYLLFFTVFNRKIRDIIYVVLLEASLLFAYIPWLYIIINVMKSKTLWIGSPEFSLIGGYLGTLFYPDSIILFVAMITLVVLPINGREFKANLINYIRFMKMKDPFTILVYLLISTLIVSIVISLRSPVLTARNLLVLVPIVYILLAIWVSMNAKFSEYRQNMFIFFVCLLCISLCLITYYEPQKAQWRESTEYAINHSDNHTLFVTLGYLDLHRVYFNNLNNYDIIEYNNSTNIDSIYSKILKLNDNRLIFLSTSDQSTNEHDLSKSEQMFLENKASNHVNKTFFMANIHIYEFKNNTQ